MEKCLNCGKETERLFKGMCSECLGSCAEEDEKEYEESMNDISGMPMSTPLTLADIQKITKELWIAPNRSTEGAKSNIDESEKITGYLANKMGLSDKEKKIYHGPIKMLVKKYRDRLTSGEMSLCKSADYYGVKFGAVVDKIGGIYAYVIDIN